MDFLTSLNFWLWTAQVVLALLYLMAGGMKAIRPIADLTKMMAWPAEYPRLTRFIGWAEVLGAIGLILPMLTGILPWLTALAAVALVVVQILAIGFHARRGETAKSLPMNLILLVLAIFIAWGRWSLFGG
jgi:hypothetical protein